MSTFVQNMDRDEQEIFDYLKCWPDQFISQGEVCLRAGSKDRFAGNAEWAAPILARMLGKDLIEKNALGHFRILHRAPKVDEETKSWIKITPRLTKHLDDVATVSGILCSPAPRSAPGLTA